ncbi:MAG: hypothetical protein QXU97_00635 [Fervidicoccaceae archaeon]
MAVLPSSRRVVLVPMSAELVDKLRRAGESLGIPFREVLRRVAEHGCNLLLLAHGDMERIELDYKAVSSLSRLGLALVPLGVLNSLLEGKREEALEEAERLGRSVGAVYALGGAPSEKELAAIVRAVFPDASEAAVKPGSTSLRIVVVAHGRSKKSLELGARFLRGLLSELGYVETEEELGPGALVLSYERRG